MTDIQGSLFHSSHSLKASSDLLPLLVSYETGVKLYKQALRTFKVSGSHIFKYPENVEFGEPQLEIICHAQTNEDMRLFAINKEKILGQGAQGLVYLGQELFEDKNRRDALVVVKISDKMGAKKEFDNEFKKLKHLNRHRAIFSLIQETKEIRYLISDFCEGQRLFDLCYTHAGVERNLDIDLLLKKKIIKAILQAYQYLHQQGIWHRDIKPENIMVDIRNNSETGEKVVYVKIIDFGTSCFTWQSDKLFSSTPGYEPPEINLRGALQPFYSVQSEYWSIGVMLASVFSEYNYFNYISAKLEEAKNTGFIPTFGKEDLDQAMPDIFKKDIAMLEDKWLVSIIKSIRSLARDNVNDRPAYDDIEAMLNRLSLYEREEKEKNYNTIMSNIPVIIEDNIKEKKEKKEKIEKKEKKEKSKFSLDLKNTLYVRSDPELDRMTTPKQSSDPLRNSYSDNKLMSAKLKSNSDPLRQGRILKVEKKEEEDYIFNNSNNNSTFFQFAKNKRKKSVSHDSRRSPERKGMEGRGEESLDDGYSYSNSNSNSNYNSDCEEGDAGLQIATSRPPLQLRLSPARSRSTSGAGNG